MKKVVFGSIMALAGMVSDALILAGSMANEWTVDGHFSALWNLSQYGLMPALYIFSGIAVLGILLAVWGLMDKKD